MAANDTTQIVYVMYTAQCYAHYETPLHERDLTDTCLLFRRWNHEVDFRAPKLLLQNQAASSRVTPMGGPTRVDERQRDSRPQAALACWGRSPLNRLPDGTGETVKQQSAA